MSEKMPREIWAIPNVQFLEDTGMISCHVANLEGNQPCEKYHHDDKYRALEAEVERLRDENKRLRECIYVAVAYAAIALEKKDFPITAHRIKEDMKLFAQALGDQKDETR